MSDQRREHKRVKLRASTRLLDGDEFDFARTENVSTGGFFVRDVYNLQRGDLLDLELVLSDDLALRIQAEVRHIRTPEEADPPHQPAGAGFSIVSASPEVYDELERFVASLGVRSKVAVFVDDAEARDYLDNAGFHTAPLPAADACVQAISESDRPVAGVLVSSGDMDAYSEALGAERRDAVLGFDDIDDLGEVLMALDVRAVTQLDNED